ncbi:oligopeptidase B, partial [Sarracenia purpurea var. burkii]
TKPLEDQIYAEIRGRIKEDAISAPIRRGPYYYYERNLEGKEYVQHCRRGVSNNGTQPSVFDVMPTGSDAPPEHVILDENIKAEGHGYYCVDAFKVIVTSLLSHLVFRCSLLAHSISLFECLLLLDFPCSQSFSYSQVSMNNKLVAYAEDTKGDEIYHAYVIDAETGTLVGKPLIGVTSNLEWAGDTALLYVTMDATLRPEKV